MVVAIEVIMVEVEPIIRQLAVMVAAIMAVAKWFEQSSSTFESFVEEELMN